MIRSILVGVLGLALGGAASAQSQHADVLGLVRTESGRPVADARVRFVPDRDPGWTWLGGFASQTEWAEDRTDERGRFRFPAPSARGCLVVDRAGGVGAVVPSVSAGVPVPVVARELGALRLATGEPFQARIRVLRAGMATAGLGEHDGTELRLPSGRYLLLVTHAGHRAELRVNVHGGRHRSIPAPTRPGPRLALPPNARAVLARWPDLDPTDANGALPELAGPGTLRLLFAENDGRSTIVESWVDPDAVHTIHPEPPAGSWQSIRVVDEAARPIPGGEVLTLETPAGGPRILARATLENGAGEWFRIERREDLRVVIVAPGYRPELIDPRGAPTTVVLARARPAAFRIVGPDGDPVNAARVSISSPESSLLDRTLYSDARGIVRLPDRAGEEITGTIHADALLPTELRLRPAADMPLPIVALESGLELHGVAWLGPELRAARVEVELRDPSGVLGVEPRITIAGDDGTFVFRGLPDGTYTLFAHRLIDGATWSGKVRGAQPGPDEWRLELGNEDPAPPGGGRRKQRRR